MITDWVPDFSTASMNGFCPPEYARMPPSGATTSGSMGRTERTGSTVFGIREW